MLLDTQEPKVFYKNLRFLKLTIVMGPHIVKKKLYLALAYFEKNLVKKSQEQQSVSILRQILGPKPAMLTNF